MPDDDRFRHHLPALAASALVTLAMTAASSWFGTLGTLAGLGGGCLISGTGTWWTERAIRRSAAIAAAKRRARQRKGRELTAGETAVIEMTYAARTHRPRHAWWKRALGLAAVSAVTALLTLSLLEHIAGKPIADVVRDRPGHGTTLSRWRWTGPAPLGPASGLPPTHLASTTGRLPGTPVTGTAAPQPDATPDPAPDPAAPGTGSSASATAAPETPTPPTDAPSPP